MKKILSCLVLLLTCCSCSCANFTPKNKEPIESSETKSVLISNVTEPQTDIWCVGTSYPNEENYSLYYFDEYQKHLDNAELPDTFIHYDSLAFLGDLFAFEVPSNTTDFSEYIYTFSFDEKYYEQMQMSWSRNLLQVKIKHHVLTELTVPEATDTPPNTEYYIANNILYEEKNNKLASITLIHNQTEYRFSFIMQEGFYVDSLSVSFLPFEDDLRVYIEGMAYLNLPADHFLVTLWYDSKNAITKFAQLMEESAARNEEAVTDTANITDTLPLEE